MTDPIRAWADKYADALGEGPTSQGKLAAQGARLLLAHSKPPARPPLGRVRWALAAACVVVAAGFWAYQPSSPPASAALSDSAPIRVGELVETKELSRSVEFQGGSRAILEPDSRGSLSHYSPELVELTLQDGAVKMDVTRIAGRKWVVKAGQFRVHVIGTAFTVRRDAGSGAFAVDVTRGTIHLEGPRLQGRVALTQGESFRWRPESGNIARRSSSPDPASSSRPPTSKEAPSALGSARSNKTTKSSSAASPSQSGWQDLASAGKYAEAVQMVEKQGAMTVLSGLGSSDRILLGNAARFSGNWSLAHKAYLAARSSSDPGAGALAAYYLARVALDGQGKADEAIGWLRTYLREAPSGELSASARARLMDLLQKSGDLAGARKIAAEYVAMHPGGPHVARAKRLTQSGP